MSAVPFPLNEQQIRRMALARAAKIIVEETQDWAAGHSMTLHPEAVTAIEDFGEHLRKKLMEEAQ